MKQKSPLFFAGQPGAGFGWGVCNERLFQELQQRIAVEFIPLGGPLWKNQRLPGPLYNPIHNEMMQPLSPAKGRKNYGYTFFENLLTADSLKNSRYFDFIFAGSTWNVELLRAAGIGPVALLLQGVNHQIFSPGPERPNDDRFYIFSGGKFELRKGQDLVLRAFQILQQRHADVVLITAWYNHWPGSVETMRSSPYIKFTSQAGSWPAFIAELCTINGIDPSGVRALPLLSHEKLASIYRKTHVGVFPNRCEGGTNLVLMEYMACGKPAIAGNWTGHTDVVTENNAVLLQDKTEFSVQDHDRASVALWYDVSLEELVEKLEWAYHHRDVLEEKGRQAAADMQSFTWGRAAETLLQHIEL
jgi:glycosyltransferase involved in cell wall biosynthesis